MYFITKKSILYSIPIVYALYVYNLHQGWLKNNHYITPLYRKPSFARYNDYLCGDVRSLDQEAVEIFNTSQVTPNKYYTFGRGITRDLIQTASGNFKSGDRSLENNPMLQSRTSNRGLFYEDLKPDNNS